MVDQKWRSVCELHANYAHCMQHALTVQSETVRLRSHKTKEGPRRLTRVCDKILNQACYGAFNEGGEPDL